MTTTIHSYLFLSRRETFQIFPRLVLSTIFDFPPFPFRGGFILLKAGNGARRMQHDPFVGEEWKKVWRVLLHWAVRDYTRYIKRFSSGISVLTCAFPDDDDDDGGERKKEISLKFLRARLRFSSRSNYISFLCTQ